MTEIKDLVELPFIEGNVVNLCPIIADHYRLYCKWMNSPESRIYGGYRFPQTIEEIKKFFEPKEERVKEVIYFEIFHKKEKKPIGLIAFNRINYFSRMGIINSIICEDLYKIENIVLEANKLIIDYGFGELNLHKIVCKILALDDFSIQIIEKLGLKKGLTLKNEIYFQGEYIDLLKYFILKRDWDKFIKK
jgi:RimJ/RimL family protein N-acetyltransferase